MRTSTALAMLLCLAMSLAGLSPAAATSDEDFSKGLSAFNSGDYAAAMALWGPLAESQDARSQAGLGFMYHRGLGVPADDRQAAFWLDQAAKQGQAEGQYMLGVLYFFGTGVPQSYVRAYAWCELAQDNGQSDASMCSDAALQSMSENDMPAAFQLVVDLREQVGQHR